MISRGLLVIAVLASCVPSRGTSRTLVARANKLIEVDDAKGAALALDEAERNLEADPDPEAIDAAQKLRLRVEKRLIEQAIAYYGTRTGDHFDSINKLHEIRRRVLEVGAPPALRDRARDYMNQRASFAIEAMETQQQIGDLTKLLALGKYPELAQDNRDRLELLLLRARRAHEERAATAKAPVTVRLHQGLAAIYGGATPAAFVATSVPEIAAVERATKVTVNAPATCGDVANALRPIERAGALQVDAEVAITQCASRQFTQMRTDVIDVKVTKSRVRTEKWTETVCDYSRERVTVCDSQNCVVTKYWGEKTCSQQPRTTEILEYYDDIEKRPIQVPETRYAVTAAGTVTLTIGGVRGAPQSFSVNEAAATIGDPAFHVHGQVASLVDATTASKRLAAAADHAKAGEVAAAAKDLETAETQSAIALLLGYPGRTYLNDAMPLSREQILQAFEAKPAAFFVAPAEPEPRVSPIADRIDFAWLKETDRALLSPGVGLSRGLTYQTHLGAFHADEVTVGSGTGGGDWAPALELRVSVPVLARLPPFHKLAVGIYDEATVQAGMGYSTSGGETFFEKYAWMAGARYTLTAGLRTRLFSLYAGARAIAQWSRIERTRGSATSVPLYGQLVFRTGPTAIGIDAWLPSGIGDRARGASLMMVSRGKRKDGQNGMFGVRVEQYDVSGCVGIGADCVDADEIPMTMYSLILGVGF